MHVIPFPVNQPELWHAYVPANVTQYIRLFSDWGTTKIDRFHSAGYDVVILDEGAEKEISGADVRAAMRDGGEWQSLVPAGVARVIESSIARPRSPRLLTESQCRSLYACPREARPAFFRGPCRLPCGRYGWGDIQRRRFRRGAP